MQLPNFPPPTTIKYIANFYNDSSKMSTNSYENRQDFNPQNQYSPQLPGCPAPRRDPKRKGYVPTGGAAASNANITSATLSANAPQPMAVSLSRVPIPALALQLLNQSSEYGAFQQSDGIF
ncbi:hypothetical protein B7494_g2255 [Chlorociboria aeruginascens]|nr:hypothetical protein B7494_g2255 [Chlorociboria aeruginascens]